MYCLLYILTILIIFPCYILYQEVTCKKGSAHNTVTISKKVKNIFPINRCALCVRVKNSLDNTVNKIFENYFSCKCNIK